MLKSFWFIFIVLILLSNNEYTASGIGQFSEGHIAGTLNLIRQKEYQTAYKKLTDTVMDENLRDIANFYRLYLEVRMGLFPEALNTFFSRDWMPFAQSDDYIMFSNYFILNENVHNKKTIISFIKEQYPRHIRYRALLEYIYYLRDNNLSGDIKSIAHYILSQRGNTWEKREVYRILHEVEDIRELGISQLKERIRICLDQRLLDAAMVYLDLLKACPEACSFDINIYYAELYHRYEDYKKSQHHYYIAQKYIKDLKEVPRVHFRILLTYLYQGLFEETLAYSRENYDELDREYMSLFLLTRLRVLCHKGLFEEALRTFATLRDHFPRFQRRNGISQLTLASYMLLNKDNSGALQVLARELSRDRDYRQNRLLLKAVAYKDNNHTEKAFKCLKQVLNIRMNNYYALFAFDLLRQFDIKKIKADRKLYAFYKSFTENMDVEAISASFDLNREQRNFIELAYHLQDMGLKDFLEDLLLLVPQDQGFRDKVLCVTSLVKESHFTEALFLLSRLPSKSPVINNMVFLARTYITVISGNAHGALSLAEGHDITKSRNFPAIILPEFLKIALYPYTFLPNIVKYHENNDIPPLFVLAVMREESRFQSSIVSWAGAVGLMQLLEETAARYGEKEVRNIIRQDINIQIGMSYISDLFKEFKMLDFTAICYNAGERRMRHIFMETDHSMRYLLLSNIVWFPETRHYLRKVWSSYIYYSIIYRKILLNCINIPGALGFRPYAPAGGVE